jgi:hypothetical protein
MSIPMQVVNRLRQGKDVAARVQPDQPDHLAWVHVSPLVNHKAACLVYASDLQVIRIGPGDLFRGFSIRRVEAERCMVEQFEAGRREELDQPSVNERFECANEVQLEQLLRQWLADLSELRPPLRVGYWFHEARDRHAVRATQDYRRYKIEPAIRSVAMQLAKMPQENLENARHQRELARLTGRWRRAIQREKGNFSHRPVSVNQAAAYLGTTEEGLARLIDWGLLTPCQFPEAARCDGQSLVLLDSEVWWLANDERDWWRGLLELQPQLLTGE